MVSANKYYSNYHARIIEAGIEGLFLEIVRWGEAGWWPENSLMRFSKTTDGPVREGSEYIQKVALPFGPSWKAAVSEIKQGESITRKFKDGFLEGMETVSLKQMCCHKVKVEYEMLFKVRGWANKILWKLVFRGLHDRNLENILDNLKAYSEKR
ncbi:MAG: hypothetical protein PHR44_00295 [Candidatus Omnitrophica bacterium]|nr:hypothetical protein [Candidatus Omnitrophota bacterium]